MTTTSVVDWSLLFMVSLLIIVCIVHRELSSG